MTAGTLSTGTAVMGVDMSLTATGICVITDGTVTEIDTIKSKPGDRTLTGRDTRAAAILAQIDAVARNHAVGYLVVEAPAYSRDKAVWDRAGLWWRLITRLLAAGMPVTEVVPTHRAMFATGRGNAGKADVAVGVSKLWPEVDFRGDDQADALVLASMGAVHLGHPVPFRVTVKHRDVIDRVKGWV